MYRGLLSATFVLLTRHKVGSVSLSRILNKNPIMKELETFHVPFAAYFWMALIWLIAGTLLFILFKFVIKTIRNEKGNRNGDAIKISVLILCFGLASCDREDVTSETSKIATQALISDFHLEFSSTVNSSNSVTLSAI